MCTTNMELRNLRGAWDIQPIVTSFESPTPFVVPWVSVNMILSMPSHIPQEEPFGSKFTTHGEVDIFYNN